MALKWLRDQFKHLKIVLWAVVGVFVLLVFVDWGAGRGGGVSGGGDVALQVGDRVVSEGQFLREVKRHNDDFQNRLGQQWETFRQSFHLGAYTAQQLVQRQLMLLEAERLGLVVADQELQEEIQSYPVFQREGGGFVGHELYKRILRANRMTAQQFEQGLREDLLVQKLTGLMRDGVYVSDVEVETRFRRDREQCDLGIIQVAVDGYLDQVEVTEEAARQHYEAAAADFQRPEQRVLRYLVVETTRLERLLPAEDSELAVFLAEHQAEFTEPEQMQARHILIRLGANAGGSVRAEAQLKAEEAARRARSGEDFAALAAEYSEDPASKDRGGDLGWFSRGRMVPEFEQAVFEAAPGDIVGPVESQYGFHVIKVEGRREARPQTLDEVRDQVRSRVLQGRAAAEAEARAVALAERLQAQPPTTDEAWQQIADEDEAVVLNISPPFASSEPIPGLAQDAELPEMVFSASQAEIGGPRPVPRGWVVWQVSEVRPAGVPPFEDVRAEAEQEVRRRKASELAAEQAGLLAERWQGGEDGEELAAEVDSELTQASGHARGSRIEGVGVVRTIDQTAFAAQVGDVVGPVELPDGGFVVARVDSLELADAAELAAQRDSVRAQLQSERANQLLGSILSDRLREVEVIRNEALIERFGPRPAS